jgi:tetratricopeptide (TPR) repeat protein
VHCIRWLVSRGTDIIVRRLGLTDMAFQHDLQLPTDTADFLIDDGAMAAKSTAHAGAAVPPSHADYSRDSLDKARAVLCEAQVLLRNRQFEEALRWFQDAARRLAAYANKTEANSGFPRWGDGRRLNKKWVQLFVDTGLGAGESCLNLGRNAEALLECTTVLTLEPDNLQALYTRGLAYKQIAKGAKIPTARPYALGTVPLRSDRPRLLRFAWKVHDLHLLSVFGAVDEDERKPTRAAIVGEALAVN